MREKELDKDGKVFSFQIYTTTEELFKKEHFRVFKDWLKDSISKMKEERRKKNKAFGRIKDVEKFVKTEADVTPEQVERFLQQNKPALRHITKVER